MTTSPSLKNVSVVQLQDGIARVLGELTGCENCLVRIDALDFLPASPFSSCESVAIRLEVALKNEPDIAVPF